MAFLVRQVNQDQRETRVAMAFLELPVFLVVTATKVTLDSASLAALVLKVTKEIVDWTALLVHQANEVHQVNADILDNLVTTVFSVLLVYRAWRFAIYTDRINLTHE